MLTNLIQIGGSKGVILPKALLQQCNAGDVFEMKIDKDRIILEPIKNPRSHWPKAFASDIAKPEKLAHLQNKFDQNEWEW